MMATQLDRIEKMLEALCDHLGVRDTKAPRTETIRDRASENGGRHVGIVSRFEHGWGFIESAELGRNFFVHYSDVEGTGLRLLEVGEEVSFEVGPGKDGRPKAVRVQRQGAAQAKPEQSEIMAVPNQETAGLEVRLPEGEDVDGQEDDMPQPESSAALPSRLAPRRPGTGRARLGASHGRRPAISW